MKIRISTLAENTASWVDLLGEWGLSILVDTGDQRILLDTGSSDVTVRNAAAMGVDLSTIDKIVLSHGHFDHTGGLLPVLEAMKKRVEIIGHPDIWGDKYHQDENKELRYIGIPFTRESMELAGASFRVSSEPVWITDEIVMSGEVPMVTEYETIDESLYVREAEELIPDPLRDDQSLFLKSDKGLVVILGCAHRGIVNTLRHATKVTGIDSIHTVVGGTHLGLASEEHVRAAVSELRGFGIQRLGVSHCTGLRVACLLAHEFGDKFFFNNAGTVTDL
ncbi:MAG: MBL fold metallo-hydrolase [Dehalococcoidia bacterium]|nr:MBL fold metallo-hydrolase [Dehalococcoidia bacterium]